MFFGKCLGACFTLFNIDGTDESEISDAIRPDFNSFSVSNPHILLPILIMNTAYSLRALHVPAIFQIFPKFILQVIYE